MLDTPSKDPLHPPLDPLDPLAESSYIVHWTSLLQVDFLAPLFIFKSINRENFLKFGVK